MLILADDLGYADVGFNGCRDIPTPHLDRLAADGAIFTQAYVTAPVCSPSRAGLLTGRYQQRFGHERNPPFVPDDPSVGLPQGIQTLGDALQALGYDTACFGKWHLGANAVHNPLRRGFSTFYGFTGGGHDYFKPPATKQLLPQPAKPKEYVIPLLDNDKPVAIDGYLTDVISSKSCEYIRAHAKSDAKPFFAYVAFNAPHTPLQAPKDEMQKFEQIADQNRRTYAAMVSRLDAGVGEIVATLEQTNQIDNTIIVFLSDNGGPLPPDKSANGSSNLPFRGRKGELYEGGIRVPLTISWPGVVRPGTTFDGMTSSLDLAASIISIAGGKSDGDGVDLKPFLAGAKSGDPHSVLYWRQHKSNGTCDYAIRSGNHKLIRVGTAPPVLYDLAADPSETTDLAGREHKLVETLNAQLDRWNASLVEPAFRGLGQATSEQ